MALTEASYDALAERELTTLLQALDALDEALEAELESGILTIELSDEGRYVINSHRAARQIWMAAERSAWHFDWDESKERWIAAKSGDELWSTLERVLSNKLGAPVKLRSA